ncbi:hypothetical protein H8L32_25080 [Undibacterium sp. CY18W]|uniref:Uncharacterized protein n=1 Tax=Undibacterium hunanense TaxID=2762292 RepID=A0ABR6ZY38_9BURK|nr:hypothetical protein [Undibacterium hunanense]MBC3920764.1 hypothetical protein [Undibacterium hunanense]
MEISKKQTITVISVEPFSPGDESASVTLRSEIGEIVAFCWPCNLRAGDVIENRLFTLDGDASATYFSDWPPDEIENLSSEWIERTGNYSYKGCARVVDESKGLVEVHGFVLELPDILCDGHVDFEIERLDVRALPQSQNSHKYP